MWMIYCGRFVPKSFAFVPVKVGHLSNALTGAEMNSHCSEANLVGVPPYAPPEQLWPAPAKLSNAAYVYSASLLLGRLLVQGAEQQLPVQLAFSPLSEVELVITRHSRRDAYRILECLAPKQAVVPRRYGSDSRLNGLLRHMLQLERTLRPTHSRR
jgi:hypothetical protein